MSVSDYERLRQKNIEEKQEMLSKILGDIKSTVQDNIKEVPKRHKKKINTDTAIRRQNPDRSARFTSIQFNRKRKRSSSVSSSLQSSPTGSPQKLLLKFPFKHTRRIINHDEEEQGVYSEDEDYNIPSAKKHRIVYDKALLEVTQEDIDNVALNARDKIYNSEVGTTCHQCRQKTLDTKTICCSKSCFGIRGQFCGPCLRNRYGEDARETLKSKSWICPPCRGICNCSFCRKKAGYSCTGILIHLAREEGYENVKDFLEKIHKKAAISK